MTSVLDDAASAANTAALSIFAESVTVAVGALITRDVQAMFLDQWSGTTSDGFKVERPSAEFQMLQADWDALGGVAGATITRADGSQYIVTNPQPHEVGWIKLAVRSA